jgi:hypothetical protein
LVVGVLGVDGSPNCGVNMTPRSDEWGGKPKELSMDGVIVPGRGVFMEEIESHMLTHGVEPPPFFGLALEDLSRPLEEILAGFDEFLAKRVGAAS